MKLKYYKEYVKALFRNLKWVPGNIAGFFRGIRREADKQLRWEAFCQAGDGREPVTATLSQSIVTFFPCGCEKEYYPKSDETYLFDTRCNKRPHCKLWEKIQRGFTRERE